MEHPDWHPKGLCYPDKASRKRDRLLIVSTGRRVWEDVEKSGFDRGLGMDIMCVKDTLAHFPGDVNHGYSEHPEQLVLLGRLRRLRRKIQARQESRIFLHTSHEPHPNVHCWKMPQWGCSGLGATMAGLFMGYHQIVLSGIHLDDSGHYYDPHWVISSFGRQYQDIGGAPRLWGEFNEKYFQGKVRALSGRLKDLLGGP